MIEVVLVAKPGYDLNRILSVANSILGYSPARAADAAGLQGDPHLLACLSAFRQQKATAAIKACKDVYDLLYYGFLIVASDCDMLMILEALGGMKFVKTETRLRGVCAIIATGTFHQWRDAVLQGCRSEDEAVRVCFDKIFIQFQSMKLGDAFGKLTKKPASGGTFLLESQ